MILYHSCLSDSTLNHITRLRSLYFNLIHPYYYYGNVVWVVKNIGLSALQKLFITQKKAVRIISNSTRRRRRKKTGAGDSLFARLNNTTTMPTLMKILL